MSFLSAMKMHRPKSIDRQTPNLPGTKRKRFATPSPEITGTDDSDGDETVVKKTRSLDLVPGTTEWLKCVCTENPNSYISLRDGKNIGIYAWRDDRYLDGTRNPDDVENEERIFDDDERSAEVREEQNEIIREHNLNVDMLKAQKKECNVIGFDGQYFSGEHIPGGCNFNNDVDNDDNDNEVVFSSDVDEIGDTEYKIDDDDDDDNDTKMLSDHDIAIIIRSEFNNIQHMTEFESYLEHHYGDIDGIKITYCQLRELIQEFKEYALPIICP